MEIRTYEIIYNLIEDVENAMVGMLAPEFEEVVTGDAEVREVFRVLESGGELLVADWGRPSGRLMRTLFYGVQLLDGFENTRDNVEGRLPSIFTRAGFREVDVLREYATVHGTLTLYRARKPQENGQEPRRWES